MNIPVLYILIVTLILLAMGRGLAEVAFGGPKKRVRLVAIVGIVMIISWMVMDLMSGKQLPDDEPILAVVAVIVGVVATVCAITSTMAMGGLILVNHKSLPGKG
jgi:uncharacterized membrane protein